MSGSVSVLDLSEPDDVFSAADVKEVAANIIGQLPLEVIEGPPLDSDDIWPVIILASVNQSSVWEVTSQTDDTPCDDTVLSWLHTLQRYQLETAANILFRHLALTILDSRSRSRGLSTRRRGTYGSDKPPVFTLINRGSDERYGVPAKSTDESTARLLLAGRQQESLTVYTDEFRAYDPLEEADAFTRKYVVHSDGEYADGDTHINTRATVAPTTRGSRPTEECQKTS